MLYIHVLIAKSMENKLSGAAEARSYPPMSIVSRPLTDNNLGRAHNPEGNGSKPFSATHSFSPFSVDDVQFSFVLFQR